MDQWRPLLVCVGLVLTFNVTNFMLTGDLPSYFSDILSVPATPGLMIVVIVLAVLLATVTFVAKLSDRIGRKPIMWVGCLRLIVGSVPAFVLMQTGRSYVIMFLGAMLVGVMLLCFNSTEPSHVAGVVPHQHPVRGPCDRLQRLRRRVRRQHPFDRRVPGRRHRRQAVTRPYLIFAGVVGIISVAFLPEPARHPLPGSAPIATDQAEAREIAEKSQTEQTTR